MVWVMHICLSEKGRERTETRVFCFFVSLGRHTLAVGMPCFLSPTGKAGVVPVRRMPPLKVFASSNLVAAASSYDMHLSEFRSYAWLA